MHLSRDIIGFLQLSIFCIALLNGCGSKGDNQYLPSQPENISIPNNTITEQATLVSLIVTPGNPNIVVNSAQQFSAMGMFSDGTLQDVTTSVNWISSNTTVALISNGASSKALASGLSAGSTTITALSESLMATTVLTVALSAPESALLSLTVTPDNPTIAVNSAQQFRAMGMFSDGTLQDVTASVNWISSNTTVALISNGTGSKGLASGLSAGSTTITAISDSLMATTVLTVALSAPGSLILYWKIPTFHADGSTLSDITGYRIYIGTSQRTYTQVIDIGNTNSFVINDLSAGVYYFTVTVYTASGTESDYSNEIFTTVL